ncbi:MAG: hypothetical protein PHV48_07380 [Candidatus Omnitrophica bacterium]|nr:hypothetical protein [Candidatus Omnitrophota bacterium]
MIKTSRALIFLGLVGLVAGILLRVTIGTEMINLGITQIKAISVLVFSNSLILAGLGLSKLTTGL